LARPPKDGKDYFPKDTGFYADDKVRLLRAEFGAKGMYLLDYLLCDLYGRNGYYSKWDKSRCLLVSDGASCGCSPDFVAEFITGCLRCSFFDEGVFNAFGVLTSPGIQRRYIRMFDSRDEIYMIREYWLLDNENRKDVPASIARKIAFESVPRKETWVSRTDNPDKNTDNSQSKGNESNTPPTPPDGDAPPAQGREKKKGHLQYPHESPYYKFAMSFAKKVQANCTVKVKFPTEANLQRWADEIRLLVESDKIPYAQAVAAAVFVTTDKWWKQGRCTSCVGFREKYTSIVTNERFAVFMKEHGGNGGDSTQWKILT